MNNNKTIKIAYLTDENGYLYECGDKEIKIELKWTGELVFYVIEFDGNKCILKPTYYDV